MTVWGTVSVRREFLQVDDMAAAYMHVAALLDQVCEEHRSPMLLARVTASQAFASIRPEGWPFTVGAEPSRRPGLANYHRPIGQGLACYGLTNRCPVGAEPPRRPGLAENHCPFGQGLTFYADAHRPTNLVHSPLAARWQYKTGSKKSFLPPYFQRMYSTGGNRCSRSRRNRCGQLRDPSSARAMP